MMKHLWHRYPIVGLIAICLSYIGCKDDPVSDSEPPEPTTITGRVIDAETGELLNGVQITTDPVTEEVATNNGRFVIDVNVVEGRRYRVNAAYENYLPGTAEVTVTEENNATSDIQLRKVGPILRVSPLRLDFAANENSKLLVIENGGSATLEWALTLPQNELWLSANPESGAINTESKSISINVDRTGLCNQEYSTAITITGNGGNKVVDVHLLVTNQSSCNVHPVASFTSAPTSGTAPLTVLFDAQASNDPDGSIIQYAWTFGDGSVASGVMASYTYSAPGMYTAMLTVTDNLGDKDSSQVIVEVLEAEGWVLESAIGPSPRFGHTTVYDPQQHRIILFGGFGSDGRTREWLNDTWSYNIRQNQWNKISSNIDPPARVGHTAVYDPVLNRMLLFGGEGFTGLLNDLWIFDLDSDIWIQPMQSNPPSARKQHTAVFDLDARNMLVMGGLDQLSMAQNDLWSYNLETAQWTHHGNTPLKPRHWHGAVYDKTEQNSLAGRMLIFGGLENMMPESILSDIWAYYGDMNTWEIIVPDNYSISIYRDVFAYDPISGASVFFDSFKEDLIGNTLGIAFFWQNKWETLVPVPGMLKPEKRLGASLVYDSLGERFWLFGGYHPQDVGGDILYDELWSVKIPEFNKAMH